MYSNAYMCVDVCVHLSVYIYIYRRTHTCIYACMLVHPGASFRRFVLTCISLKGSTIRPGVSMHVHVYEFVGFRLDMCAMASWLTHRTIRIPALRLERKLAIRTMAVPITFWILWSWVGCL